MAWNSFTCCEDLGSGVGGVDARCTFITPESWPAEH